MLKLYFSSAPNPPKVALFLEEAGLDYEVAVLDLSKGEQFSPEFLRINPNGKLPAIDDDGRYVFDSNAILLYLADKTGKFLSAPEDRGQLLSWLMFVASGLGPFSGQAVWFSKAAPEKIPYAQERYNNEARRHYTVLDKHLTDRRYMVGDSYTIADMDVWGWARFADYVLGDGTLEQFPALKRLVDEVEARPAAQRVAELRAKYPPAHQKATRN